MELITIHVAEVAGFVHTQDDALKKAVKAAKHILWRHLTEVPGTNRLFYWFEDCVLADALRAPKY